MFEEVIRQNQDPVPKPALAPSKPSNGSRKVRLCFYGQSLRGDNFSYIFFRGKFSPKKVGENCNFPRKKLRKKISIEIQRKIQRKVNFREKNVRKLGPWTEVELKPET
jgi:hypothetical protein